MPAPIDTEAIRASVQAGWFAQTLTRQGPVNFKFRVMRDSCADFHTHDGWDECFFVLSGEVTIDLEAASHTLAPGQFLAVPRGALHRSRVVGEATLLVLDQAAA